MGSRKTIVFAGHFTVGTIPSDIERRTLAAAACHKGDPAVLVNDIGVFRRMVLYLAYGEPALAREVRRQPRCGTIYPCGTAVEDRLENVDWRVYDAIRMRLGDCGDAAAKHRALRSVIDELVADRIAAHGLDPARVRIFYERRLRNLASARLRNRTAGGAASWRRALQKAGLLDDVLVRLSRIPTCGGILLALYEQLAREGYNRVVQYYAVGDQAAIENGVRLYGLLSAAKGWMPLEIENCFLNDQAEASVLEAARV